MGAVRVFLSGAAGAGKTVYLASLFHSLANIDPQTRLRCETNTEVRNLLRSIYVGLSHDWPEGNQIDDVRELPFSFYLNPSELDSILSAEVTFYDCPGDAIAPPVGKISPELRERMDQVEDLANSCHVIVSVVDGKLAFGALADPEGEAARQLANSLLATFAYWSNHGAMVGPDDAQRRKLRTIHYFVITKWDLFEDSDDTLARVRALIMDMPILGRYISRLDATSRVRFIPVSAVGKGFAELEASGEMKIVGDAPSEPINVLIPVASLIPDLIDERMRADEADRNQRKAQLAKLPWHERLLSQAADFLTASPGAQKFMSEIGLKPNQIAALVAEMRAPLARTAEERRQAIDALTEAARSQNEAAEATYLQFKELRDDFDAKYSSSLVIG